MLTDWQTANDRNDRERISRVRQVAEDLFKPRQQTIRPDVPIGPDSAPSAEYQHRRQPRILATLPQRPTSVAKTAARPEPKQIRRTAAIRREIREILASQQSRVRALTSYGMTREQVAELYGVTVDEVERVLSHPGHTRAS